MRIERRILWTGGFDSTWLVLDALRARERVEAIVWRGWGMRESQKAANEDAARARITAAIPAELRRYLVTRREADPHAWSFAHPLWEEFCAVTPDFWSPQNYILAALPQVAGRGLETAYVASDLTTRQPGVLAVMEREGLVMPVARLSKQALLANSMAHGFAHLLALTWSCEGDGSYEAPPREPCGVCGPCEARIIAAVGRGLDG